MTSTDETQLKTKDPLNEKLCSNKRYSSSFKQKFERLPSIEEEEDNLDLCSSSKKLMWMCPEVISEDKNDYSEVTLRKSNITYNEKSFTEEKNEHEAGVIETNDEESDEDNQQAELVGWLADDQDYQRPAKLEILVGFLRLLCFVSVCTSVFAIVVSILSPLQQAEMVITQIWQTYTFENDGETFKYLDNVEKLNPYYEKDSLIFNLICSCGIIQLAYLLITAGFVIIDSIATVTFR